MPVVGAPSGAILWQPDAARIERSHLQRFTAWVAARHGRVFPDYASLHGWSVDEPTEFWGELATFCDLRLHRGPDCILDASGGMAGARWFAGATLNVAENLLRFRD